MRVYLLGLNIFSEINKKEEITWDTYLLTDHEESQLRPIVEGKVVGKIWTDSFNQLKWSVQPSPDFVWDEDQKEWILDEDRLENRLEKERQEVWEQIKKVRYQHQQTGVYLANVDKWFHSDQESVINYQMVGNFIRSPNYVPVDWKTMDNSFIKMTPEIYESVMLAIFTKGQHDFKVAEMHRLALWEHLEPYQYDYSTGWSDGYKDRQETDNKEEKTLEESSDSV